MVVKFNNLTLQWEIIKKECKIGLERLFERSNFILGEEVQEFEHAFAQYVGCKHAIGVSNGTDALKLSAQALTLEGNSCFVLPALTFVATLGGIEQAYPNATYHLIDCDEYFQMNVEHLEKFVSKNRGLYENMIIVPVHLYGYACDMTSICHIAETNNCRILEDSSQAHGTRWKSKVVGSFGDVSAFSLYPGKNLGAAGDAGIITTNDSSLYERILMLRNLGSVEKHVHQIRGGNHRLDTIQAIVLKEKIKHIEEWNEQRRRVVSQYEKLIKNSKIRLPTTPKDCLPTHHVYPVLVDNRDEFTSFLDSKDIQWGIHYKVCIEKMKPYQHLSGPNREALAYTEKMVSLPIHPFMTDEEVNYLCGVLNQY